jgi:DNA-binding response OmpR family regulator
MSERRALIVDDDAANCSIFGLVLAEHGYEVAVATSLNSAMASMQDHIDLYLVDNYLPDGSGIDMVAYVRENYPSSVVLTTSMDDDAEVIRMAIEAGSNVYLVKPTSPSVIGQLLSEIDSGTLDSNARQLINRNGRRTYSQ